MARILIVPDIYFHRWDQPDGELWMCVRPFVRRTEFADWAASPHSGSERHRFELPARSSDGGVICKLPEDIAPINLPTSIDIWMRVIRGPRDPVGWVRVARSTGCVTDPAIVSPEVARDHKTVYRPGTQPMPFNRLFNQAVLDQYENGKEPNADVEQKRVSAICDWLQLRLESGKPEKGQYGSQLKTLYRNEADGSGPAIPFFRPFGRSTTSHQQGEELLSTLYWFCGLMLPLGRKPVAGSINGITGFDLWLVDASVQADAGSPPTSNVRLKISLPDFVRTQTSDSLQSLDYFSRIRDTYPSRLVCTQDDPETLTDVAGRGMLPMRPGQRDPIVYFSPSIQGFQKVPGSQLRNAWEFVSRMNLQSAPEFGLARQSPLASVASRRLGDLVGLEVRASGGTNAGTSLQLAPGIVVAGRLKPYRRFPRVPGPGALLPTVMVFEPGADGSDYLDLVETRMKGQGGIASLIGSAVVPGGWKLQLLDSRPLPWDGAKKVYRVVATPPKDAQSDEKGARTCDPVPATLSFRMPALATLPGVNASEGVRWLWKPDEGIKSIDALRSSLRQRFGNWVDLPFNALFVEGAVAPNAVIDGLFLGDYTFTQANSRWRLETILGIQTMLADRTPENCVENRSPDQDFEDDFVNFNTASALTAQGALLDNRARFAQIGSDPLRGLMRHQKIPLVFEWEHAPNNSKSSNPKAPIAWTQIRDHVKRTITDPKLPTEPFRARVEHTYCAVLPAVDPAGNPIEFSRSPAFDWLPDLPTSAESIVAKELKDGKPVRFLECSYVGGAVQLIFHARVLNPAALEGLSGSTATALSQRAWRSVAEMLRARSIALKLELRLLDMTTVVRSGADAAADLARRGFSGHWREALRQVPFNAVAISEVELGKLKGWCRRALSGLTVPSEDLTLTVAIDSTTFQMGRNAHVARVSLEIVRDAVSAPPPFMRLVPTTRQPTLGAPDPQSLMSAWAQIGFGRDSDLDALPENEKQRLQGAFSEWRSALNKGVDSITPTDASTPPPPEAATSRADAQALISELEGTDWFAPADSPRSQVPLNAQVALLPLGFAPCAHHPQLGRLPQLVLQRALSHLNDAIDLAYEDWVLSKSAAEWMDLFKLLAALAPEEANGEWTGKLPDLLRVITSTLLKPQPDPGSSLVDPDIVRLIAAYKDSTTALGKLPIAAQRLLLESPALFSDAKAMLLSRVSFLPSGRKTGTPPEFTLARAQFTRIVRPPSSSTARAQQPEVVSRVDALAGWRQMVSAGIPEDGGTSPRIGFLEVLDDARYDNAFSVHRKLMKIESFESMLDPNAATAGSWDPLPPMVPGKEDNGLPSDEQREVRLASREILEAPVHLWSGENAALAGALANSPANSIWTVSRLSQGLAGGEAGARDRLTTAAYRRDRPAWHRAPSADEVLVHFVYCVSGDEEAAGAGMSDAFENDGFFLDVSRTTDAKHVVEEGNHAVSPANIPSQPVLSSATEQNLRKLVSTARGSPAAAKLAMEYLLKDPAAFQSLGGLVRAAEAQRVSDQAILLRPIAVGTPGGGICIGGGNRETRRRVREVALLRPATSEKNSIAYLVVGAMLDVWTSWEVKLVHGRNLPFDQWDAQCARNSGRIPAPFAPSFWQAAAQSGRPVTHQVNRTSRNHARHWPGEKRVFSLPDNWYGRPVAAKDLLDRLLFQTPLAFGEQATTASPILGSAAQGMAYSLPFGVTVYQEQFDWDSNIPREVRFPFRTVLIRPGELATAHEWFPEEYTSFSVDIRWRQSNGSTPLTIERIFARHA